MRRRSARRREVTRNIGCGGIQLGRGNVCMRRRGRHRRGRYASRRNLSRPQRTILEAALAVQTSCLPGYRHIQMPTTKSHEPLCDQEVVLAGVQDAASILLEIIAVENTLVLEGPYVDLKVLVLCKTYLRRRS